MNDDYWIKWQTIFTGIASLVALCAILASISLTYRQIDKGAEIQREATGRTYWLEFIKYTAEHPEFTCPADRGAKYVSIEKNAAATSEEIAQMQKYFGYLVLMLSTFETVLDFVADPGDEGWRDGFRSRMACHGATLTAPSFRDVSYCTYSRELRQLMADTFQDQKLEWPDCSPKARAAPAQKPL